MSDEVRPITDDEAIAEAPCPYCRAEAGEPCVVAGDPRRQTFPGAHMSRRMNAVIFKDIRAKRARERETERMEDEQARAYQNMFTDTNVGDD